MDKDMIRQGDVLLVREEDGRAFSPLEGRVILARGEVTGHVHAFDPAFGGAGVLVDYSFGLPEHVSVPKGGAWLRHGTPDKDYVDGDHAHVKVPEGKWEVRVQREANLGPVAD